MNSYPSGGDIGTWTTPAQEAERLGFTSLWTGEAYGFDAITPLAWLAGQTTTINVGTRSCRCQAARRR